MCGRYAMFGPHSRYRDHFGVDEWPDFPDRYNIAPSASVAIVRQAPDGRRLADVLRWGLIPHWAKDATIGAKLINARGESVAEKPSFRSAYRHRRCIVPASGFYEWKAIPGQTWKQPYFARLKAGDPMGMGGLWESWTSPDGEIVRTFCIVTRAANDVMRPIHDRMPVILSREAWPTWLDPDADLATVNALVASAPSDSMEIWPVSRKVGKASEDGPELIQPL